MYKFKIESLNCMSCFHNIEDSLKDFDKTINAKAEVSNQLLLVETTHPLEKIKRNVRKSGDEFEFGFCDSKFTEIES